MTDRTRPFGRKTRLYRISALLLAVVLLALSFASCKTEEEDPESSLPPPPSQPSDYFKSSSSSSSEEESSEPEPEIENEVDIIPRGEEIAAQNEKNSDTVGWIYIPDTEVNDAVVQRAGAKDNNYYLRKNRDGHYSWYGCFFADYESVIGSREELSRNNIIYAHNLGYNDDPDRPDFSQLFRFLDQDFAESHPYIFFSTEDEDMIWEVFAVFYSEATSWYILVNINDNIEGRMIKDAQARSQWIYDVDVKPDDKLLTLSTCSYKYGGALNPQRFVVMARLVERDRPLPASITLTANPDPVEPVF